MEKLEIIGISPYQDKFNKEDNIVQVDVILNNGEIIPDVFKADSEVSFKMIGEAVLDLEEFIIAQYTSDDNDNYGLLFYACGYDGKKQNEMEAYYAEKGIYVF